MSNKITAYLLYGVDNDSYMLGEETRKAETIEDRVFFDWRFVKNGEQHPAICVKCGRKTDPDYIDPNFKLSKRNLDFSSTFDGYIIVSDKFKEFLETRNVQGVAFVVLPSQPKRYRLVVNEILKIDTKKSQGLRFLYHCDLCQKYAGVFGTRNLRFKDLDSPITHGIFRSDLEFAQAHEQAPLIVVGTELAAEMKTSGMSGLKLNKLQ